MDSRSQFEAWFLVRYPLSRKGIEKYKDGDYVGEYAQSHWTAWQESRAAIEVELPAYRDAKTHGFSAFNDAMDLCENEIRKHGISIKEELPLQHEAKEE